MSLRRQALAIILSKTLVHLLCLGWLLSQYWLAIDDRLGADPVESLIHFTGIGALNLLLLSLAISPAISLLKQPDLAKFRRLIGLYAFVYAALHLLNFIAFELQFDWRMTISEIVKRPYITLGMLCFLILLALAVTSISMIKRKMGKGWQLLHNWVYLASLLAIVHFAMSVKLDLTEPILYAVITVWLLWFRKRKLMRYFR